MNNRILYIVLFALALIFCVRCRVVKMGQFYLSENHQKPKQKNVPVYNDPSHVFQFAKSKGGHQDFISNITYTAYSRRKPKTYKLSEYLDDHTRTTAFLVVRNDTILFEEYYEGYDETSLLPSWSVAKSFTSALVGIAIQEGFISESDKVAQYFPELNNDDEKWNQLTIEHLLNMRSGIDFNEDSYSNPYSSVADLYMTKNIMKKLRKVRFKYKPGTEHYYSSFDTEILGLALEKALDRPLSAYLQEKIWRPLGMEYSATWTIDSKSNNNTKAFCCLNVALRDYAKFARLYLNKGNWNGEQLIDDSWINKSVNPNFDNNCYQNQWYSRKRGVEYEKDSAGNYNPITYKDSVQASNAITDVRYQKAKKNYKNNGEWAVQRCGPGFFALGIFGQEVYVDPESEMIFIRLGKKWDTSSQRLFSLITRELENKFQ